jgi:hypothetical protein
MTNFPADTTVQSYGSAVLMKLAVEDEYKQELTKLGAPERIAHAMKTFPKDR